MARVIEIDLMMMLMMRTTKTMARIRIATIVVGSIVGGASKDSLSAVVAAVVGDRPRS